MDEREEDLYGERFGPGAVVGEYLVEALIAEGGHAFVYRASPLQGGGPVALKVLKSHLAAQERVLRRFQREARALLGLRSPHVVEVLGHGEHRDGRPYLAMEYLAGPTLAELLARSGPLPWEEAVRVLGQVAGALEAAHALGLVHRDLKAQNVVAGPGPGPLSVKLIDFGIAKEVLPASGATSSGLLLGTPLAMAPEQIRGGPVDARTDLYAAGVLLYQLLVGRPPFEGEGALEVEEQHLHRPPPLPSARSAAPAALDRIVQRCLEKDPAARYPSARALAGALAQALAPAAAAPGRAVALLAQGRLEPAAGPLAEDALDAALERVRAEGRALGLAEGGGAGNLALLVGPLPEGEAVARLGQVQQLAARLAEGLKGPGYRLRLVVHVAEGAPGLGGPGGPPGLGALARIAEWAGPFEAEGATATPAARALGATA